MNAVAIHSFALGRKKEFGCGFRSKANSGGNIESDKNMYTYVLTHL